jgi:hypothetical protein
MGLTKKIGQFPGGYPYVEYLRTAVVDLWKILVPDGSGGGQWVDRPGSILLWGCWNVGTVTTPLYLAPGNDSGVATAFPIQMRCPRAGRLQNLVVRQNIIYGAQVSLLTYTARVENVASALSAQIAANANDANDQVNSVVVAKGDRLDIEVTKAAALVTGMPFGVIVTAELL